MEMSFVEFEERIDALKEKAKASKKEVMELASYFDDTYNLLEWWVKELNFGKRYEYGCMLVGRKPVELYTAENIYNALCGKYDFEV